MTPYCRLHGQQRSGFFSLTALASRLLLMVLPPSLHTRQLDLDAIERLSKLAEEVQERLPRLNEWVAKYKRYRREVKRRRLIGDTEQVPPPKMPEDLTIFDEDPNLADSDSDAGDPEDPLPDLEQAPVNTELNPLGSGDPNTPVARAPAGPPASKNAAERV